MNFECHCQSLGSAFANVEAVMLQKAYIVRTDSGAPGQFLLAPSFKFPQHPYNLTAGEFNPRLGGSKVIAIECLDHVFLVVVRL